MAIRYPTNYDKIADIPADLEDMAESIQDELDLKVNKVTGKGLSTNDYTDDEKSKLAGIATGAEVNAIETVKVNGTALTPSNKAVDVTVPTKTSDLTNDSGFGTYTKPSGGIPKTDLASAVQTSLEKADSAVQDVSGKEDKSNKVTSISSSSTNTQYPGAKLVYDELKEKQDQIDALVEENTTLKAQIPTGYKKVSSTTLTDASEGLPTENVAIWGATSQVQYDGKNLWGGISYTKIMGGINFEQKNDGSIIVNGTSTGNASSLMSADAIRNGYTKTLSAGTYVLSGGTSNVILQFVRSDGSTVASTTSQEFSKTFTLSAETVAFVRATVENGVTVNNETVYIQLEEGTTAHDWEPYVGETSSPNKDYPQIVHKVTGNCNVKGQNKNFLPNLATSRSVNGINFVVNEDKSVTINGTATQLTYLVLTNSTNNLNNYTNKVFTMPDEFSRFPTGSNSVTYGFRDTSGNYLSDNNLASKDIGLVYLNIASGATINNLTVYPQIEEGSTPTNYVPHAEQNAPQTLGDIDLYEGDKIEISYVNKAGYKKVTGANRVNKMAKYTFTGNENYTKSSISDENWFCGYILNGIISNIIMNSTIMKASRFSQIGQYTTITDSECISCTNQFHVRVNAQDLVENSAEAWKNLLKTWYDAGEPLYVVYPLATPTTTPITDPTLLAQLETLINLKTYKEVTHIDATGEDLAPVLEFNYYKDMTTIFDNLEARVELLEN